jgi:predicted DNA-binding transcriptional regulator AlpA
MPRTTKQVPSEIAKTTRAPVSSAAFPASAPIVMTVAQVASYLQIPVSSIYEKTRYRGRNRCPLPCRRVGKYLRFIFSEVQEYVLSLPLEVRHGKRAYRKRNAK